jgi:hypothetical protein
MVRTSCYRSVGAVIATLMLGASIEAAQAQLSLDPTVTPISGGFRYEYTVNNNTAADYSIVNINTVAQLDAIAITDFPTGFNALYDSGLGIVSFFEDTSTFAAMTSVSGFAFESPFGPGQVSFDALETLTGDMTNGVTIAAVPEPGSLALWGACGAVGLLILRRRRTPSP